MDTIAEAIRVQADCWRSDTPFILPNDISRILQAAKMVDIRRDQNQSMFESYCSPGFLSALNYLRQVRKQQEINASKKGGPDVNN